MPKEKKRNEKNLNPPECIAFRIPKGNSNLAQAKKEEKRKKETEENWFLQLKLKRRQKKGRSWKK